jgi:hypothetical protein
VIIVSSEWATQGTTPWGGINYVFCAGTTAAFDFRANNAANRFTSPDHEGLFQQNGDNGFTDATDGASNTLLAGEVLWVDHANNPPGNGTGGKPHWATGIPTQMSFSTAAGINANWEAFAISPGQCRGPNTTSGGACGGARHAALQSDHTGGCHVALADGSARFISQNISQLILDSLATRSGKEITGDF